MNNVTKIALLLTLFSIPLVSSQGSSTNLSLSSGARDIKNPLIESANRTSTNINHIVNEYFGVYQEVARSPVQPLTSLALSPDGSMIIAGVSTWVKIWKKGAQNSWSNVDNINFGQEITALALSADKKMIVVGGSNGIIKIYHAKNGVWHDRAILIDDHLKDASVYSVVLSEDKKMIVSKHNEGTIVIWKYLEKSKYYRHEIYNYFAVAKIATASHTPIVLSSDKKILITGNDGYEKLEVYKEHDDKWTVEATLTTGHFGGIGSLALSADNSMLVSGSLDDTIKIWKSQNGQWANQSEAALTLQAHNDGVPNLVLTQDKKMIVAGFSDGTIKIWEVSNNGPWRVRTFPSATGIDSLALSADKKTMVTGSSEGFIIWNYTSNIPLEIAQFIANPLTLGQISVLKLLSEYKKSTFSPLSYLKYSAATHSYLRDVQTKHQSYLLLRKAFEKDPKMLELVRRQLKSFPDEIQNAIVSYYGITDLSPSKQEIEDDKNERQENKKELERVVKKMDQQVGREKLFEKALKK